ncbi:Lysophospholipase, alpha-beta hydrolase superfamily [Geodermatophilus telluris]|uniref:Lysophospholipase, alpha-beta hydrolase superfamily n=1 Tax=Geodermatophilus telluris TaxID=1190417 RepID=A0A1G6RR13_9ACTN|nr:alpha/beta fold hydrolase [Geodermatophilus telluris]SDD06386.1 Lysophospholipase, alpha-beta hydrolase superfamily [Geodermatophilus telluris]
MTQHLDRPGGRIAFDVEGEGPLVVCVPGMGDLRQGYRHLAPGLVAGGYRVATVDLRGHGDSDATFPAYDVPASVDDLRALIGTLGGPAVVVGTSMGASVAALLAAESPDAVGGLVLAGPFLRDGDAPAWQRALLRLATARPWAAAVWRAWLPRLYAGHVPADQDGYLASVGAALRRPGRAAAFSRTTRASHAATEARLGDVRAPALVVVGARDPDWPDPAAEAAWAASALGGEAEVLLVEDAGHYPAAQRPDVLLPAVLERLGRWTARA